ncbi:GNAT family N-acetyltransferase [Aspergillus stella-maris]|uniref:GNAT family N-acetyltransferase n=1 Tax=Aspergillus stella-maris TaxID=1810926 RepID=UPI003CCE2D3B
MSSQPPPPSPILHLPQSNTIIRPFHSTPTEAQTFSFHANNKVITKNMRNAFPYPYTPQDATNWFNFTASQNPRYDFAIADAGSNEAIGAVGLKPRTDVQYRSMEIGYWVAQDYWGRGIATEVVLQFSKWAFEQFPQLIRLEAEVFDGNEGSRRVLEKAGYQLEGRKRNAVEKDGVVLDTFLYSLLMEEVGV